MTYDLIVDVDRHVAERYKVQVRADTQEEAMDIAYEYFSDYPNSDMILERRTKEREATVSVEIICIEMEDEGLIQDVFSEDDGA